MTTDLTRSHSAYWLGKSARRISQYPAGSPEHLDQLRSLQRGVASFVRITTGRDIPVQFSGGTRSYTNGRVVTIAADTDPNNLDSMVGLALHEGSHCVLSEWLFVFLGGLTDTRFIHGTNTTTIADDAKRLDMPLVDHGAGIVTDDPYSDINLTMKYSVFALVHIMMNVLEDRRIDAWMYRDAPGYRPYYDAMYQRYWHSSKVDAALQHPAYRVPSVENYLLHVINMTNPHFDPTAMPGLQEILDVADLNGAGLTARAVTETDIKQLGSANAMPRMFVDAAKIVEIILANSTMYTDPNAPKDDGEEEGEPTSDLPNLDPGSVQNMIRRLVKFLDHRVNKESLSPELSDAVSQFGDSDASICDVPITLSGVAKKTKIVVYRNVTRDTAQSLYFPFHSFTPTPNVVQTGMRMGRMMAHRIAATQDESALTFTRQRNGRLDRRLLSGLGFDQTAVFSHTFIERKRPVDVWLDVDLSGSMAHSDKYNQAMSVAVAIATAASVNRILNVTIAVRSQPHGLPVVAILYDSTRHDITQLSAVIPHIRPVGGTPEGLCFEAMKDEILARSTSHRRFFINISDGEPAATLSDTVHSGGGHETYGGEPAWRHTRDIINQFRADDIKVMSYFIGNPTTLARHAFTTMYGADARFIDVTRVNEILKTLNQLLLR